MGKVVITVTCDWDALDYKYSHAMKTYDPPARFHGGIDAILEFHQKFNNAIPITHFICPAYFCRNEGPKAEVHSETTVKMLHGGPDEVGLHIHCWQSLMEACDVTFRDPATDTVLPDWGRNGEIRPGLVVGSDYGHGVPLGVYSKTEITKIIRNARTLLCDSLGMPESMCTSFRGGGWMTSDRVLTVLEGQGFVCEASAVDASTTSTWSPSKTTSRTT